MILNRPHAAARAARFFAEKFPGTAMYAVKANPSPELLQILWDTLEDHTVHFRGGPLFAQWRAIVGPFFAQPPVVEHFELVGKSD